MIQSGQLLPLLSDAGRKYRVDAIARLGLGDEISMGLANPASRGNATVQQRCENDSECINWRIA